VKTFQAACDKFEINTDSLNTAEILAKEDLSWSPGKYMLVTDKENEEPEICEGKLAPGIGRK